MPQPLEINQQVVCSNCGLELEVIWLYPLELASVSGTYPEEDGENKRQKKVKKGHGSIFTTSD